MAAQVAAAGGVPSDEGRGSFAAAFLAFRRSARRLGEGGDPLLGAAGDAALALAEADEAEAARFFATWFEPTGRAEPGIVTGYFEPELPASRRRSPDFPVPLYRLPPGYDVKDAGSPGLPRSQIEAGALAGLGLELVWLADAVDAFFVHVQGSARLRLAEGGAMRVGFAGRNHHPYTSIARLALERGWLARENADKDGLERWLRADAARAARLMRENASFIFFREVEGIGASEGPLGAAGVPLTPLASIAVDPAFLPLHTPVLVTVPDLLLPGAAAGFSRLMIAQDVGAAIRGAGRGDLFIGSGAAAGSLAGGILHAASIEALMPRSRPA